jgi:hypothetical protein
MGCAGRQAGRRHACAKTTGKTSGAVMIVMRGSGAAVPAMLVSARFSSSDRRGEADSAAANEGKRAEDQEKTSRYWPHDRKPKLPHGTGQPHSAKAPPANFLARPGYDSRTRRSRSALPMTETELNAMASAAMIGLSKRPNAG